LLTLLSTCTIKNKKSTTAIFYSYNSKYDIIELDTFKVAISNHKFSYSNKSLFKTFDFYNDSSAFESYSDGDSIHYRLAKQETIHSLDGEIEILHFESINSIIDGAVSLIYSPKFGIVKKYSKDWNNYTCLADIQITESKLGTEYNSFKTILLGSYLKIPTVDTNVYNVGFKIPFD
jgi:hypothetical protein